MSFLLNKTQNSITSLSSYPSISPFLLPTPRLVKSYSTLEIGKTFPSFEKKTSPTLVPLLDDGWNQASRESFWNLSSSQDEDCGMKSECSSGDKQTSGGASLS